MGIKGQSQSQIGKWKTDLIEVNSAHYKYTHTHIQTHTYTYINTYTCES